ncbi:TPA: hypothetical protein ACX6PM_003839 [Photobacterium damselae]
MNNFGLEGVGVISNGNALVQSLFFISSSFITVYGRNYTKSVDKKNIFFSDLKNISLLLFILSFIIALIILLSNVNYAIYYSLIFFASGFVLYGQFYYIIPFSENKTYILPFFDTVRLFLRFIFIILSVYILDISNINTNGVAVLISSIIVSYIYFLCYKKKGKINKDKFVSDITALKNSLWVLTTQFGSYLLSFMDVFVVNILFGYVIGGKYSLILQLSILAKSVALVLIGSYSSYVINMDFKKSKRDIYWIFLSLILLISYAFAFLFVFKIYIFKLWLNINLEGDLLYNFNLINIFMYFLCISNIILPLQNAVGLYKFPAKLTLLSSVLSILILFLLKLTCSIEYIVVFIVIYTILIVKNLLIMNVFCKKINMCFYKNILLLFIFSTFLYFIQINAFEFLISNLNVYFSALITLFLGFLLLLSSLFLVKFKLVQ